MKETVSKNRHQFTLQVIKLIVLGLITHQCKSNPECLVDKCKFCPEKDLYICRECESGYYLRTFFSHEKGGSYNDCWSTWKLVFSILGMLLASMLTCGICYWLFKIGRETKLKSQEIERLKAKEKKRKMRAEMDRDRKKRDRHVTETERDLKTRSPPPEPKRERKTPRVKVVSRPETPRSGRKVRISQNNPYIHPVTTVIHHPVPPMYLSPSRPVQASPIIHNSPEKTYFQQNQFVAQPPAHQSVQQFATPIRVVGQMQRNPSQVSFRREIGRQTYTNHKVYNNAPTYGQANFHTPQQNRFNQNFAPAPENASLHDSHISLASRFNKENFGDYNRVRKSVPIVANPYYPHEQPDLRRASLNADYMNRAPTTPIQLRGNYEYADNSHISPIRPVLQPQSYVSRHPFRPRMEPLNDISQHNVPNPEFPYPQNQVRQAPVSPYMSRQREVLASHAGTVEKKVSSPRIENVTVQEQLSPERSINVVKPMLVQDTYIVEDKKLLVRPGTGVGRPKEINRRTVTSHQDIMDLDDLGSFDDDLGTEF